MDTLRTGITFSLALHALAFGALPGFAPARGAPRETAPIVVQLRAAEPEATPAPVRRAPEPGAAAASVPQPIAAVSAPASSAEAPQANSVSSPAFAPAAGAAPAPATSVARASAGAAPVTPPLFNANYLRNPAPVYPALSRRLREQGRVVLRVHVNASGAADEVAVHDSSGSPRLDEAAYETVLHWTFTPARRGNEPIAAWVLVPVSFRLES
jgi:periplasmic protein TonB